MKLSEIFDQLTYGELSQLAIGGFDQGGIQPKSYPVIISHLNLVLTKLHTRFPLQERELTIQQYDYLTNYKLHSDFAVTNTESVETPKYITDTETSPFTDDIIQIERAFDESGLEIPINDTLEDDSIFLPAYNVVQIPQSVGTNAMFLTYRANHPKIDPLLNDPTATDVNIPDVLLEAVLKFIAARVHGARGSEEGIQASMLAMQQYEAICQALEYQNVLRGSDTQTKLIWSNGWV